MDVLAWLDYELFGNSLRSWGIGLGVLVTVQAVLFLARRLLRRRLQTLVNRTGLTSIKIARHVVGQTKGWFLLLLSLAATLRIVDVADNVDTILNRVIVIGFLVQMGYWAVAALTRFLALRREQQLEDDPGAVAAMDVVSFISRVAVWAIVLLLALDNLGVNITALVAGLGVGGIAVALAAQNIIGDLFASLSIVLDRPFALGDFLVIDDLSGTVEKVGLKTTRIRSLSGEELVVSNNDLLASRIRNYGRMSERRIVFRLGVIYQTSHEHLNEIPKIIEDIIVKQENARFDRAHFQSFGDFSLNFEIVYYVQSNNYVLYMDIQQAVNLEIYRRFAEAGIEFAYPTRTLYVSRDADASA